jgi:hypothetical protein
VRRKEKALDWLQTIRDLNEQHFSFDWWAQAAALNERFQLKGGDALRTNAPGLPPMWFNGDIEAIQPGRWVLVVSLNHNYSDAEEDLRWYVDQRFDSHLWWDYMRTHNRDWWYSTFFGPLVRLAAGAIGEEVTAGQESEFATTRIVFLELCPYSSHTFSLPWETIEELSRTDPGFGTEATIRKLLIEDAEPALVLVNGKSAIWDFERIHEAELMWTAQRYPSVDNASKPLWHKYGSYLTPSGRAVPAAGFPFLRKRATHNSYAEITQLAERIRNANYRTRRYVGETRRQVGGGLARR